MDFAVVSRRYRCVTMNGPLHHYSGSVRLKQQRKLAVKSPLKKVLLPESGAKMKLILLKSEITGTLRSVLMVEQHFMQVLELLARGRSVGMSSNGWI